MKLSDLNIPDVYPTEIEGLYVKDIALNIGREAEAIEDAAERVLFMFQNILCAEDGSAFEDAQTLEEVEKMGQLKLRAISRAAVNVFRGKDDD